MARLKSCPFKKCWQPLRKMILIEPPRSTIAARREPLNRRELARFAGLAIKAAGCSGPVSILLTSDERIRELNREFRGKNVPTDVLLISGGGVGVRGLAMDIRARALETSRFRSRRRRGRRRASAIRWRLKSRSSSCMELCTWPDLIMRRMRARWRGRKSDCAGSWACRPA